MPDRKSPAFWPVAKRQLVASSVLLLLLALVVGALFWKDRQREWRLRQEQAAHRLVLAYELIARDLERVRSDVLYVANQQTIRDFDAHDLKSRTQVEMELASFLKFKRSYQQMRLIDNKGMEVVRVDMEGGRPKTVPRDQLQDKKDRYYVVESFRLQNGEIFVSEFDLNQEYGEIERPLNPVIRFVTPVGKQQSNVRDPDAVDSQHYLLVANYRGSPLLNEIEAISLPGRTYLVRSDGQYLLGPTSGSAWGWLLDHESSFQDMFPEAWRNRSFTDSCQLTSQGAFAFREIHLTGMDRDSDRRSNNQLLIVSHLPRSEVFITSQQLLNRLSLLTAAALLPLLVLTWLWAVASSRRKQQRDLILQSEKKLRSLSSRLVEIQEDERRAISREIHDQLGQQVTAINLDLKLAYRESQPGVTQDQLSRAINESQQLLDTLHDFASRIRPVELDDLGLHDAVESYLWSFKARSGIECNLESNVADRDLPSVVAENSYRLVQESLNNVLKHANATHVNVAINLTQMNGERDQKLSIVVQDDGSGVPATPSRETIDGKSGLGILGMQERVDLLGGKLKIESAQSLGTSVHAVIPINDPIKSAAP